MSKKLLATVQLPNYPGFSVAIFKSHAVLICRDNYGKFMWDWESSVKVPQKLTKRKLQKIASEVYSEWNSGIQTSAL